MFVSILQRSDSRKSGHPGEPLQSRADSSTRASPSGRSGEKVRVSTGLKTAGTAADKPDNQVKDRHGPGRPVPPGTSMRALPKLLPRGDTL
jgi:hypothetical protein